MLPEPPAINKVDMVTVIRMQMVGIPWLPLLSVAELLMSPVMKEDSCFLTVSFHIRLIRLYTQENRKSKREGERRKRRCGQRHRGVAIMKGRRNKRKERGASGGREDMTRQKRERNMVR